MGQAGLGPDFNPDQTRVATVPQELLAASARQPSSPSAGEEARAGPLPRMPAVAAASPSSDELHFQETYRDFVATRERCGEMADGLSFEKFAVKLRRNRDQLIQKYSCRTVRFQVYVKEGKAALRASPVKD